jgi:RNA polymerase sigma-70 factor, ECF subfamily
MDSRSRFDVIGLLAPLRRYAAVLTRNDTDADDLVHDALIRAYERQQTFHSSGNLRAWLFSVLHNSFIDGQRRKTAEAARAREVADVVETVAPADQDSSIRLQQIGRAFLTLPDEQRAVLHLVAIEGLPYKEAANALGIPVGTLMSRLGRARAALRTFEENGARSVAPALPAPAERPARPNLRVVGGADD